jgi:hypothetical protein
MALQSNHPVRDSFLRLVLLLVWYGEGAVVGFMAVCITLVFAGFSRRAACRCFGRVALGQGGWVYRDLRRAAGY